MNIDNIKTIANSQSWIEMRELFLDFIKDTKDVTVPMDIKGITVNPGEAYLAKLVASQKLEEFVDMIDRLRDSEPKKTDAKDLFV